MIIFIDGEEFINQLRYTDGIARLPSIRSVSAFMACRFNSGTSIGRYSSRYSLLRRLVSRFSLWRCHNLIMIFLFCFRTASSCRKSVRSQLAWDKKLNDALSLFYPRRKVMNLVTLALAFAGTIFLRKNIFLFLFKAHLLQAGNDTDTLFRRSIHKRLSSPRFIAYLWSFPTNTARFKEYS